MNKIVKTLSYNLQSILGWRSKTKYLIIESDDWGTIRMPSKEAYNNLLKNGIRVDKSPYERLDALETKEDLEALFEVLQSFKDHRGNYLKMTANAIMANPDFVKIKESGYEDYFYEDFVQTQRRINGDDTAFLLMKEGMEESFFIPQLHGREHLHVNAWLEVLQQGHKETILAFDNEVWGHPSSYFKNSKMNFLSGLHIRNDKDLKFAENSIADGMRLFEKHFGFKSSTFIAPRYIWNDDVEKILKKEEVSGLQGLIIQQEPNGTELKQKRRTLGAKNKYNQTYLVRNVFFEPAQNPEFPWLKNALERIKIAFFWGKPAIISSHRLNYMGAMESENRRKHLSMLKQLITEVQKIYPEVVFLSSDELSKIIHYGK